MDMYFFTRCLRMFSWQYVTVIYPVIVEESTGVTHNINDGRFHSGVPLSYDTVTGINKAFNLIQP